MGRRTCSMASGTAIATRTESAVVTRTWSIAPNLRCGRQSARGGPNLPLVERGLVSRMLGRWLTAFAADGCFVRVLIFPLGSPEDVIGFDGKWASQREPISTDFVWTGSQLQRIDRYDPQKLPGIHETTLQPGRDGEMVAIGIRERGAANAYAYWAERIYADAGGRPFPEHPDCELPPGQYRVTAQARAGEVHSAWRTFELLVDPDGDSVSLTDVDATS
jgi:hypothetical protein